MTVRKATHGTKGALAVWLALFGLCAMVSLIGGASQGLAQTHTQNLLRHFDPTQDFQLGAPQSSILTIQPDRLFAESAFGKRISREVEAEGAVLTAENRRIEAELRAEEQDLTKRRATIAADAFRALADAFDEKVQETRRIQDQKLREISQLSETARREFFAASLPLLEQIMRDAGAGAILDHSTVFLSSDAVDITDLAISRIDKVLGDGLAGASLIPEQLDEQ